MPSAGVTHHLTLAIGDSVVGYIWVPGSYQGQTRVSDFAPRISTGTDPTLREGYWEAWAQKAAVEGIDQISFENDARIYSSDGNVYTGRPEAITLDTVQTSSDAAKTATAPQIIDSGTTHILVGAGTKVRRYSIAGGTWSDSTTTLAASAAWLHRHNGRDFCALGSGQDLVTSTDNGDNWSAASAGTKADGLVTFKNKLYLWLGTNLKASANKIGGSWSTANIEVGDPGTNITNAVGLPDVLIIRKEDGLYYYDGTEVKPIFRRPTTLYSGNKCLVFHSDSFLYYNEMGRVKKASFSQGVFNETDITPLMWGSEAKELYGHGIPIWMWTGAGGQLYVAFDGGQNTYPEVLKYNGLGWHQAYLGTAADAMRAGGYSRAAGFTLWNDGATRYRRHTILRDVPYPNYATSGVFVTSDFQVLPFSKKAFRDIRVEARNLSTAAGRKITVEYSVDQGTTWVSMGDITVDGKTLLTFDPTDSTIVSEQVRLRFTLTRGSTASETPVLARWSVSLLNRPDPVYGYRMTLKLAGGQQLLDGTVESLTTEQLVGHLLACDGSAEPVLFTDYWGLETYVFFTRLNISQPSGDEVSDERLADVEMVESLASARWDAAYYEVAYYS